LTQYVMGGDFSGQTDNLIYDPSLEPHERKGNRSGLADDRWVFTEQNPGREFHAIANIAASVGPMRDYSQQMAEDALAAATELWAVPRAVESDGVRSNKLRAAVELFRATGNGEYRDYILAEQDFMVENF